MCSRCIVSHASRFISSLSRLNDCDVSSAGHKVLRSLARVVAKSPNYDAVASRPACFSGRCTFKGHMKGKSARHTSSISRRSRAPYMTSWALHFRQNGVCHGFQLITRAEHNLSSPSMRAIQKGYGIWSLIGWDNWALRQTKSQRERCQWSRSIARRDHGSRFTRLAFSDRPHSETRTSGKHGSKARMV
jgi:hypothetical protein